MQAHHDDKITGLVPAALLAIVVSLVGVAGAVKIAQTAVNLGPGVGDIVRFDPQHYMPVEDHTRIDVTRANASGCVLDLDAIHRAGGSFVVEQKYVAGTDAHYRVHWAGWRSADGTDDCGRQADLRLDGTNLDLLAMAAGGWGAGHRQAAPSDTWSSVTPTSRVQ